MIRLTEQELVPVFLVLKRPGAWGGNKETLLAQAELYRTLRLHRFAGLAAVSMDKLSQANEEYDLSPAAVDLLAKALSAPGQDMEPALLAAAALERLGVP